MSLRSQILKAITRFSGSTFFIVKTIISSDITVAAQDLTTVATGRLLIEDIIVKTDSVGLAGATNFRILSDNDKGELAILESVVSGLDGNKTFSLKNPNAQPSVVSEPTVLEAGKKLQFLGTSSPGSGAGTIDVIIKFRRIDKNATLKIV